MEKEINMSEVCNICQLKRSDCVQHYGILEYLHNLNPNFAMHAKFRLNQARAKLGMKPLD